MRYMGNKSRYARVIAPIVRPSATGLYIEPFVGSAGMMQHVRADVRIGIDRNPYIIALLTAIQDGWMPPKKVTEEEYAYWKANQTIDPKMTGFVGFGCSFGGMFFGSYAKSKKRANYAMESRNSLMKSRRGLRGCTFLCGEYHQAEALAKRKTATIYCDPPYAGTAQYGDAFDSAAFWKWADRMVDAGHRVFVSEYNAPEHWKCLYSFSTVRNCLGSNRERLFVRKDSDCKPVGFGLIDYQEVGRGKGISI